MYSTVLPPAEDRAVYGTLDNASQAVNAVSAWNLGFVGAGIRDCGH